MSLGGVPWGSFPRLRLKLNPVVAVDRYFFLLFILLLRYLGFSFNSVLFHLKILMRLFVLSYLLFYHLWRGIHLSLTCKFPHHWLFVPFFYLWSYSYSIYIILEYKNTSELINRQYCELVDCFRLLGLICHFGDELDIFC